MRQVLGEDPPQFRTSLPEIDLQMAPNSLVGCLGRHCFRDDRPGRLEKPTCSRTRQGCRTNIKCRRANLSLICTPSASKEWSRHELYEIPKSKLRNQDSVDFCTTTLARMFQKVLTHSLALASLLAQSAAQCTNALAVYNPNLRTMSTNSDMPISWRPL